MSRCEQFSKTGSNFRKMKSRARFLPSESRARFSSVRVSGSVFFVQSLGLGFLPTESRAQVSSVRVSGSVFFVQSLGLGFLPSESRARILLNLSSLGLGFSNKGLGVSASLGFYHSPPLPEKNDSKR